MWLFIVLVLTFLTTHGSAVAPPVCAVDQFQCSNGDCISELWRCDGETDCEVGEDEFGCEPRCDPNLFRCHTGQCVPMFWRCDGTRDCFDGSDEKDCMTQATEVSSTTDDKGDSCTNSTCSQLCESTPLGPHCSCHDGYILDTKDNETCCDVDECQVDGFCSQMCSNFPGGYNCSCLEGYQLVNGTKCQAEGSDPLLIFSTLDEIRGMRIGSSQYYLVRKADVAATAVDADPTSERIFWIELSKRSTINSVKIDGSNFQIVLSHGLLVPEGIAVDYVAGNIYLADSGLRQILVCKMDGTMCHVLHDTKIGKPRSILVDPSKSILYWSDWGEQTAGIYRSGMDGSRRIALVSEDIGWPNGIAVDHTINRLFWADAKKKTIESIGLNGSSRKVVLDASVFLPYSLAVFEDEIYWTDWSTFSLESCNKFTGGNKMTVTRGNMKRIMGVHIYHPVLTHKVSNPCRSSQCSHICLLSPGRKFRCACPPGFNLSSDTRTCTMQQYYPALFVSGGSTVFSIRPEALGSQALTELPLPLGSAQITKVAYDPIAKLLFVADTNVPAIHAVNMTTLRMWKLVQNNMIFPEDIALDTTSNNLYWVDSSKGTVEVIAVSQQKRATLVEGLKVPFSIAISKLGYMFVASREDESVFMYDMDGKNPKILSSIQGYPLSIAVHPTKSLLYWADPRAGTISSMNFTSLGSVRVVVSRLEGVTSVVSSKNLIYWTNQKGEVQLQKSNITRYFHTLIALPIQESRGVVIRKITYSQGLQDSETYCSGDDFKCRNGRCILKSWHCDRRDDCGDNSDEENCLAPPVCGMEKFQCNNGECISKLWRCDGETDCVDGEDESGCNATRCDPNQFRCDTGQCVPMSWRCDGVRDCFDGTDDEDCNQFSRCKAIDFKCEDGNGCLDESLRCNGKKDCKDGSDEKNCPTSTVANCKDGMFPCSDGICIYEYEVCDGHEDCTQKEDESNCTHIACQSSEIMCPDGRCIKNRWICDGDKDCIDGSDEGNCTRYFSTTEASRIQPPLSFCDGFFCYETGNCLTWSMVCDGNQDCTEMPDEGGECHSSCSYPFNGGCTQNCQSTPQGPKCFCFEGYRLLSDKKTCADIDECMEPGFCSHFCSNTNGSFECSCATGYFLHNSRECKADGGPASLVYLLGNQIRSIDLVSYSESVYLNIPDADIRSMDYDATDRLFYLTEFTNGTINTYSPDTQRMDVIVRPSLKPQNVKYDWIVGNLYYSDEDGNIGACSKDGRFCSTLLESGVGSISSLDISPTTGLLFWTMWLFSNQQTGIVIRAEMDGSARLGIITSEVLWPTSLTIDHLLSTIYWIDMKLNTLECADFQGLKRRQVKISGMYHPFSMSIFEDDVYWADWGIISIRRCNKFTGIDCTTVKYGDVKSMELLLVYKAMQPKGVNKCLNSSCPHLCLPTRSNFVCKCADGFMQVNDTCQPLVPVYSQPTLSCPRDYCLGGGQCTVENGTFTCKCTESYTGTKCQIEISAVSKGKEYNFYSWIVERLDYNRTEKQEPVPEDGQ